MNKPCPTTDAPARDGSGSLLKERPCSCEQRGGDQRKPPERRSYWPGRSNYSGQPVGGQKKHDIKGQLLPVTDPLERTCFEHKYDTAGNNLWTEHLDSGEKMLVVDAQGKPLYSSDAKGAAVYTAYDDLHRPTDIWAKDASTESVTLRQHMLYGDSAGLTDPHLLNLKGQLVTHYDEAGKATITGYDFKGNPLEKVRQVIADEELTGTEKYVVDWDGLAVPLDAKEYVTGLLYDGLNRVRKSILPEDVDEERKEMVATYNRAGALEAIRFNGTDYVRHIAYNAKGQRVLLAMGNGMMTRYAYDPIAFRLQRIKTERYEEEDHEYTPQSGSTKQDSAYEYDLGGNILKIKERVSDCGIDGTLLGVDALDRVFQYDPLKRLFQATGRESDTQGNSNHWEEKPAPGSPNAHHTRAYTQTFLYDKVGNILKLGHQADSNNYNRHYRYVAGINHLEQLDDNGGTPTVYASFTYDAAGNQRTINTDRFLEWDAADQLRYFKIDDGTTISVQAHYLYAGGDRVKKLVRDQQGNVDVTVYIDGVYEHRYRKDSGGDVEEEQNILHVMDGRSRIATVRLGDEMDDLDPPVKYNLEDHLGTSTTRLTDDGTIIDREEYYPFGESSLRTFEKKRYRYVSKELDRESGLYYYGARYYAAWVGRFVSVDPLAHKYTYLTPYNYAGNKPINDLDIDGMQSNSDAPDSGDSKKPNITHKKSGPRIGGATIEIDNLPKDPTPGQTITYEYVEGDEYKSVFTYDAENDLWSYQVHTEKFGVLNPIEAGPAKRSTEAINSEESNTDDNIPNIVPTDKNGNPIVPSEKNIQNNGPTVRQAGPKPETKTDRDRNIPQHDSVLFDESWDKASKIGDALKWSSEIAEKLADDTIKENPKLRSSSKADSAKHVASDISFLKTVKNYANLIGKALGIINKIESVVKILERAYTTGVVILSEVVEALVSLVKTPLSPVGLLFSTVDFIASVSGQKQRLYDWIDEQIGPILNFNK